MNFPRVVAHRGVYQGYGIAENSRAAVRKAAEVGARAVEVDVHVSADGVSFSTHDEIFEGRPVRDQLSRSLVESGLDPLDAVLLEARACDVRAIIEVKPDPGREDFVADAVQRVIRNFPEECVYLSSFSVDTLSRLTWFPRLLINCQCIPDPRTIPGVVHGVVFAATDSNLTRAVRIRSDLGLTLGAYGVGDPARARTLFDLGVNFVITDRPDLLCGQTY